MKINLFNDFNPVSEKQWKQKIQADLKGDDYNDVLIWKTNNQIDVKPFYSQADIENLPLSGLNPSQWNINVPIKVDTDNEKTANTLAQEAINGGANCIEFIITSESVNLEVLLEAIDSKDITIYIVPQFLSIPFNNAINKIAKLKQISIFTINDPIGHLARSGNWYSSFSDDFKTLETIISSTAKVESSVAIHANLYQNSGATIVQQLAYALAHANEYANAFKNKLTTAPHFYLAVGSNYFFEIAKLRALRILWVTLAEAYNLPTTCFITAIPSRRNKTLYDYNTNLLRTTTEYMSAALGGANSITTLSYDAIYKNSHPFSRRIARNQLLILKEESYFNTVQNAADGAYYIESLTHQLAEKALAIFKTIEEGGGFLKQLKDGIIQRKIKESAAAEQTAFNSGELVLIGSNKHPNKNDTMKNELDFSPFIKKHNRKTLIEPILEKRLSAEYEKNRLKHE